MDINCNANRLHLFMQVTVRFPTICERRLMICLLLLIKAFYKNDNEGIK